MIGQSCSKLPSSNPHGELANERLRMQALLTRHLYNTAQHIASGVHRDK
jgi:hypothetical protein